MMTIFLLAAGAIALLLTCIIGINDNPPGILLLLLGSCAVLLGILHRRGASRMPAPSQRFLYWAPRVLCIVFAAFTSIFALDVFDENAGFWRTSLALLLHLVPTFTIIVILVLSWRREWIGGVLFIALGLLYVVLTWSRFPPETYLIMSGPLVLTGALFLLNWWRRADLRPGSQE